MASVTTTSQSSYNNAQFGSSHSGWANPQGLTEANEWGEAWHGDVPYYYNATTHETQWERPDVSNEQEQDVQHMTINLSGKAGYAKGRIYAVADGNSGPGIFDQWEQCGAPTEYKKIEYNLASGRADKKMTLDASSTL